jgi:hypothetical protein
VISKDDPQTHRVQQILLIREQDGPPERELKRRLAELFRRDPSVKAAYLARVSYVEAGPLSVALCLRAQRGPDTSVTEKVGQIFASMFGHHEHLDIVFLSAAQEAELAKVCVPFFTSV